MRLRVPRFDFIHKAFAGRPRTLTATVAALAIIVFLGAGWVAWFSHDLTTGLPDRTALRGLGDMAQATTLLDAADKPVFTIFKEQRIEVPLEQDLAEPDQGGHLGRGSAVLRARRRRRDSRRRRRSSRTSRPDGAREGGSTITQQLARQSFLSRDKTYRRKLKEVILAAYIEQMYGKNEILELYLNKVYFGDGLYGVEAASRGYFGKSSQRSHGRRSGAPRRL